MSKSIQMTFQTGGLMHSDSNMAHLVGSLDIVIKDYLQEQLNLDP